MRILERTTKYRKYKLLGYGRTRMEISIDEAGSFGGKTPPANSWCVVVAFVEPEAAKRKTKNILRNLKISSGFKYTDEVKLGQVNEDEYFKFLNGLGNLTGTLFAVATDTSLNLNELVIKHKELQSKNIISSVPKMIYDEGKQALKYLASQLDSISPQLYIQLVCQVQLMSAVVDRGINYYVQRIPSTLSSFKWRIDHKDPNQRTAYEDAFEKLSPALLQSFSLQKAGAMLNCCNYKSMSKFMYQTGEIPEYLISEFPKLKTEMGLNIQKIIRDDIKFVDSKFNEGVQIADLLASGLRRLLKGEFKNSQMAASLFAKLFVQEARNASPLKIITFGEECSVPDKSAEIIRRIIKECRPILFK
jgi:Protein of unknown function (DUF3800)